MVNVHRGPRSPHELGHRLGCRPRLAEEQALAALGDLRRISGHRRQVGPIGDQQLLAARLLWRIDNGSHSLRGSLEPGKDGVRVAYRGAQPHPLHVMARELGDAFQDAHQVRPPVGAGDGVHLINDHHSQIPEESLLIDPLGHQHDLERLGRGHEQFGGFLEELATLVVGGVAVPHKTAKPDHLGVQPEPFGLIVQQRLDRSDVDGSHTVGLVVDHVRQRREHRRFGLAACRGGEDDRVVACQQRLARLLLHQPQTRPAEARHDGLLQAG